VTLHSVGIVTALASEASVLTHQPLPPRKLIELGEGCGLWLSGMGPLAARQAALALVNAGAGALAVFGVAGALAPGMHCGTLLCPARVVDEHGHDYLPTPAWRNELCQHLVAAALPVVADGRLLSLASPLLDASSKAAMHARYQAHAVDMESAAVAAVATEQRIPFVVLRAIVDEYDDDIPATLQTGIDEWGRPRPLAMLALLGRQPAMVTQLPRLALRMRRAIRALRASVEAAGINLGRVAQAPC
jgi:adenosylhomocysteine nucleosidase